MSDVDIELDITDPQVPVLTVRMCNQCHGAAFPGDTVTVAEALARALIREGLAEQVRPGG